MPCTWPTGLEGIVAIVAVAPGAGGVVPALQKQLEVTVPRAALLALDGTVHGINSAENAPHGRCVAAKDVCARPMRFGTVWTIWAVADPKQMFQCQEDQDVEAVGASDGIAGQESHPLIVVQHVLCQGHWVQM